MIGAKLRFNILVFLLSLFHVVHVSGQGTEVWTVNPHDYSSSMSFTGFVILGGSNTGHGDDRVAAFIDDECRGVATPVFIEESGQWVFFMTIYSNVNNQHISFRYYKSGEGKVYDLITAISFEANAIIGSPLQPRATSDVPLTEAEILSFELPGQVDNRIIGDTIHIIIACGIDITDMAAVFTASPGALVRIGNIVQFSGKSKNDFSNIITYKIQSGDGLTTRTYHVKSGYNEPVGSNDTETICSNVALDYDLQDNINANNAVASLFTYTVLSSDEPNVPAAAPRAVPSAGNITDAYENTTGSPVTITYTIAPTSDPEGCTGETFTYTVTVNPAMHLTLAVIIDSVEVRGVLDTLYVFADGFAAGKAVPQEVPSINRYRFTSEIFHCFPEDTLTFRYFENSTGLYIELVDKISFSSATVRGTLYDPIVLSNKVMTGNSFTSFHLPGQVGSTLITEDEVIVKMPVDRDLSNIAPVFEQSPGAIVLVADSVQYSGITKNDFPDTLVYKVFNYNRSLERKYNVITSGEYMNVIAVGYINNKLINSRNDTIYAFIHDEVTASSSHIHEETGQMRFHFHILSYWDRGEIRFAYKDNTGGYIFFPGEYAFESGKKLGTGFNPVILAAPEIEDCELLSFELEGQKGETMYQRDTIKIIFEPHVPLDYLKAWFSLTPGARLFIADSIQYPGITGNNFNTLVNLRITNPRQNVNIYRVVKIIPAEYLSVEASSIVSPDGDGINDFWIVKDVEKFRDSEFIIFDYTGRTVFRSIGYDNNWDWHYNNRLLPVGTYYYVIRSPDDNVAKGVITLVY